MGVGSFIVYPGEGTLDPDTNPYLFLIGLKIVRSKDGRTYPLWMSVFWTGLVIFLMFNVSRLYFPVTSPVPLTFAITGLYVMSFGVILSQMPSSRRTG